MKFILYYLPIFFNISIISQSTLSIEEVQNQLGEIKASEIKTACNCCDGMEKIADILVIATERFYSKKQAENDPYGSIIIELTNRKTEEVAQRCMSLGIKDSDIFECPSFPSFEEKAKLLNQKFRY
jgi:hypothetical protein